MEMEEEMGTGMGHPNSEGYRPVLSKHGLTAGSVRSRQSPLFNQPDCYDGRPDWKLGIGYSLLG